MIHLKSPPPLMGEREGGGDVLIYNHIGLSSQYT
jgi:hypothetical protein